MVSALCNDVPPWQRCDCQIFCESQDVGLMEEIAAPAAISQEITLKVKLDTHSLLLLTAVNTYQILHETHSGGL